MSNHQDSSDTPRKRPPGRATLLSLAGVGILGAALYFLFANLNLNMPAEEFQRLILSWGRWGVVASLALMVAHSFVPFPAEFLALANGMVYGVFWGTVITWAGAMLGAALAFALTRRLGVSFARRMISDGKWQTVDEWISQEGAGILFVSRFIPIISFNLINIAAGLTRIGWWTFLWVTAIGILPVTVLMVGMGNALGNREAEIWGLLFATVLLFWMAWRYLKSRKKG